MEVVATHRFLNQRMRIHIFLSTLLSAAAMLLTPGQASAEQIRIAVASNFVDTLKAIAEPFETHTGHNVTLIVGSTGKHYAQIKQGAPFDVFFAADSNRPMLLENEGDAVAGSRITYALGKIVLWSPKAGYVDAQGRILEGGDFRYLAIANPELAPYGKAAQQVLQTRGLWGQLKARLVRGENIGQTFQFVKSGNAELGFVAYSQVKRPAQPLAGSLWQVPQTLYTPIEQQAVLLRESDATRAFMLYVRSDDALKIIHDYGYDTP
jgi:molybdate transport system substrate-binding protein